MVMFSGLNTVADMRNASRQGKAKKASDRMATRANTATPKSISTKEEKPVTDTSGTAKDKDEARKERGQRIIRQLTRRIEFGAKVSGPGKSTGLGVLAGFLGTPFTKRIGGNVMTVDTRNQQVVPQGVPLQGNKRTTSAPAKKAPPPSGTGIDAPEPDTGWRPSGINSAGGLMSAEMGVPLQETIGVSLRRKR